MKKECDFDFVCNMARNPLINVLYSSFASIHGLSLLKLLFSWVQTNTLRNNLKTKQDSTIFFRLATNGSASLVSEKCNVSLMLLYA
jgi:hypothetical protein